MKKTIWVVTLFPEFFVPLMSCGVLGKALRGERSQEDFDIELKVVQLRDFANDNYKGVDDSPYGGGQGMVMRADILENALKGIALKSKTIFKDFKKKFHVIFPCPRGPRWSTQLAQSFAQDHITNSSKDLIFICGRYEGVDERFLEEYVDAYYSLGDYILTGGELAVMVMLDSSMRFVEGVLGNRLSANHDSFSDGLIEHPQYTRPAIFNERCVPSVLTSGHHKNIDIFNQKEKERLTKLHRPDLWDHYEKNK